MSKNKYQELLEWWDAKLVEYEVDAFRREVWEAYQPDPDPRQNLLNFLDAGIEVLARIKVSSLENRLRSIRKEVSES